LVVLARVVALYNSAWPTSPAIYKEGAQREMVVRKRLSVLWAAAMMLLTVLVCSGIAWAVTYGVPDENEHPYVGLVAFKNQDEAWRCSGTLLSPTVFLTAGHCTDGAVSAKVWFDSTVIPSQGVITGTPHTHPDFEWGGLQHDHKDVGVVVLDPDQEVPPPPYPKLPDIGFLDALATERGTQEQTFTIVGYGLQSVRPSYQEDLVRYKGTVSLIDLRSAISDGHNIQITKNPGQRSSGGQCPGDSGGPYLYEEPEETKVVGIASFSLNDNCKGTAFAYRTDIAQTQDWLSANGWLP
jgi:hypothetical protein